MSNACDPRNRPGFVAGDPTAFLSESTPAAQPADELRTVLLATFATAMIVATVLGIVFFSA
jgi:hypothetical protein